MSLIAIGVIIVSLSFAALFLSKFYSEDLIHDIIATAKGQNV